MDKTQLLQTILTYLVPLMSVVLSYFFGRIQTTKTNKTSAKREQYEEFYLEYTSKIYIDMMWHKNFRELPLEEETAYINLLMKNIKYLDSSMAYLVLDFYKTYVIAIKHEHYPISDKKPDQYSNKFKHMHIALAHKTINQKFNNVTIEILKRTSKLSKELKLPDFAELALKQYSELIKK